MENPKSTPKDVFWYLLLIITLYAGVVSFITLLVAYVGILLPDPLEYAGRHLEGVRGASATLIVMWPVFMLMSWLIGRDLKSNQAKRELRVRRWLVHLTLFVAALTMIIDLIVFVNRFYGGELTGRFALNAFIVLATAGAAFGYYLWDMKNPPAVGSARNRMFAWGASLIVLIAIAAGFWIVGSPAQQRAQRLDIQRVNNLQFIQAEIVSYWQQKDELPSNVADLQDSISGFVAPIDPETGQAYEYNITGDLSFELCAIFNAVGEGSDEFNRRVVSPKTGFQQNWDHEAGRTCFERDIDPELHALPSDLRLPVKVDI